MKKIIRLLSYITPVLLIGALLLVTDFSRMAAALKNVNVLFYLGAFAFYALSYFFRTLRLSVIFQRGTFGNHFLTICGHMLLNHILPFRMGEISLPFFLKRLSSIPYPDSVAFFVLLRLFDMIAIFISFLLVFLFLGFPVTTVNILLIVFLLVVCVLFVLNLGRILPVVLAVFSRLIPGKLSSRLEGFSESVKKTLAIPGWKLPVLFLLSVFDRICNYGMTILLVRGMAFSIPVLQLVVANAAASLTNILPINSIGSFGTLELGWAGALMSYGVPSGVATASGLGFHLLAFSFTIVLGMPALLIMKMRYNINPFRKTVVE